MVLIKTDSLETRVAERCKTLIKHIILDRTPKDKIFAPIFTHIHSSIATEPNILIYLNQRRSE